MYLSSKIRMVWFPPMLVIMLMIVHGVRAAQTTDSDGSRYRQLQSYLKERGLDRLVLRLDEIRLARESDDDRRAELALNLARQYTNRFYDDVSRRHKGQLVARAQQLLQDCPETPMPDLQVAVAHADYLDAESAFLDWWRHGASPESRDELQQSFRRLQKALRELRRVDQQRAEKLSFGFQPADGKHRLSRHNQSRVIENRLRHASYLSGWTGYFLSVIPEQIPLTILDQAERDFYESLGIEQQKPIEQIHPKWLDYDSPSSELALLGLAMVYTAKKQWASADFCFDSFAKLNRDASVVPLWRYNSLAFSRQWNRALELARHRKASEADPLTLVRFWQAVAQSGCVAKPQDELVGDHLLRCGLLGMLRQFEMEPIREIVNNNHLNLKDDVFEDLWIKGFLLLQPEDDLDRIERATSCLKSALQIHADHRAPEDTDRIRYLLALAEYQLGRPANALSQLSMLGEPLLVSDADFAEKALWLKCRALIRMSPADLSATDRALSQIDNFLERFPESRFAPMLQFDRVRVSCSLLPPEQALARLQRVAPGDPQFEASRAEMIRHQHRLWRLEFQRKGSSETLAFETLVELDRQYRQQPEIPADRKRASILFVLDAALQRSVSADEIARYLEVARGLSEDPPPADSLFQSRLNYYRFLAARKFGDQKQATSLAEWLSTPRCEPAYRIQALTYLADKADQTGLDSPAKLIPVYEQLTELLGSENETIARSRNARVASHRLVELYLQENRLESAERINRLLLDFKPDQAQYLLNAARIEMKRGAREAASAIWRRLAAGSPPGSDLWLESKLGLASCLTEDQPETARQLLRQTIALSGELSEPWRLRFQELDDQLTEKAKVNSPSQR